jgi:hypothetical protein
MGSKDFFKELENKKKLVDELKEALIEESPGKIWSLNGGEEGLEILLAAFMSTGNMAYRSGDGLFLEYFFEALLEVVDAEPDGIDTNRLFEIIPSFGLRAIRDTDPLAFSAVVGALSDTILDLEAVESIDRLVKALSDLTLKATDNGLESWAIEVVNVLCNLDRYFDEYGLGVSRVSLRNAVVSLVHALPEGPAKDSVAAEAKRMFSRDKVKPAEMV